MMQLINLKLMQLMTEMSNYTISSTCNIYNSMNRTHNKKQFKNIQGVRNNLQLNKQYNYTLRYFAYKREKRTG